ncbi:MAG: NADH-quinone oxidoreductase subunit NuoH [Anaerolineales bacterium]
MTFLSDPISYIGDWLENLLIGLGLAPNIAELVVITIGALVLATVALLSVLLLIWFERKAVARMQDRIGPNRLGPYGIFQSIADVIKLITKEYITPVGVDKVTYNLAPLLAVMAVIGIWAVIPFSVTVYGSDLNVGVLYIVAVGAIGVLAIIMAGWSSNNKYALLGAFRAVSQLVSYEVPLVTALLIPVMLTGSMSITSIVEAQNVWYILIAPLGFVIFLTASIAEVGRAPFDLLEADSEIVAGFNIEYSSMKFGMFFVAEFLHAFTIGAVGATLFLGGWRGPGSETYPILGTFYFLLKAFLVYFVVVWARGTFPRVRIDQLLNFSWKFLTPLALVLLIVVAVFYKIVEGSSAWVFVPSMFAVNILIALGTIQILRKIGRRKRMRVSEDRPVATAPESDFQQI